MWRWSSPFVALGAMVTVGAASAHGQTVEYRSAAGVVFRSEPDTGPIARATRALAADPRSVEGLLALGLAQAGAREYHEAIGTFTRGLAIAPNDARFYRWRGHRHLSVGEFDQALDDLTRSSRLDSTLYGAWYHLGIARYAHGDFAGAAAAFGRAQPIAPDAGELAGATDWRWMSLSRAGRTAEAQAMLDRHPDSLPVANAYAQRLRLYRGQSAPDAVLTAADTGAVAVATLSYGIGNWYLVRGDTGHARAWFQRSVQSGGWPAFGFLMSERELRRIGASPHAEPAASGGPPAADGDVARWQRRARAVTITRDDWGIPHVRGATDADAVFGVMYAQAEDDLNRIETNYLNALGRLAEAEGESAIYRDLRMKLFVDPDTLRARYAASPAWLQRLMDAYADGLNYYLHTHPRVVPRVIRRYEPWMALAFTEGSIGGDIERISLADLEAFYGPRAASAGAPTPTVSAPSSDAARFVEPTGSNGFAIAPSNTANHHALLLINPHTSFFFRAELQATSDEGLNAYGAATWGQFFVYQGFNARVGWMHTSSGVDAVDEFAERISDAGGRPSYRYGTEQRPVTAWTITVPYRTAGGTMERRAFTAYRTHHGPIVRAADGRWISIALMQKPIEALSQSYLRTKAHDYRSFREVMELHANSSNNTIFADADGEIAYFHPQFIPKRDDRFDYTRPVDGSDPATDWHGLHTVEEAPHLRNPANGWIANTNNWPYSAAGAYSPKRAAFPRYMDVAGENPRGVHAARVLQDRKDFTLPRLITAAYDPYLTAFAQLVPPLVTAYDGLPASDPRRATLAGPIALLRAWDYRWSVSSAPTSLAVFWGEDLWSRSAAEARAAGVSVYDYMASRTTADTKLQALAAASDRLVHDFGSWRTPWGEINRFQRRTGDIVQPFSDSAASIPVGFTSSQWGSLASFGARAYPGTRRYYGTSGNSFVAVVEFGDSVRARAVSAGGESGDATSPHFDDQAARYTTGALRDVYFYPDQLRRHAERVYHPGAR